MVFEQLQFSNTFEITSLQSFDVHQFEKKRKLETNKEEFN